MGRISSYCIACMMKAQEKNIRNQTDEKKKAEYMKELCRLVGNSEEDMSVPVLVAQNAKLLKSYFGITREFAKEKKAYNEKMLLCESEIRNAVLQAENPLKEALKYARVGNYIDFGAVDVKEEQLQVLLDKAAADTVDEAEYANLCRDMEQGTNLVYLTDNCGEIVLDKIFIEMIQKQYPHLNITVVVRGAEVLNDATYEDAEFVGLTDIVPVISNGCDTAGTPLDYIAPQVRELIEAADLVIAKGQGNFETMNTCGLNVYYMFLCKCEWFEMRFQLKKFDGVLVNDRNLK